MATSLKVKRGDTWTWTCPFMDADDNPVPLDGVTARLQVRDKRQALIADYSNQLVMGASDVSLSVLAALPLGTFYFDIELTFPDGTVASTDTMTVSVTRDETREAGA